MASIEITAKEVLAGDSFVVDGEHYWTASADATPDRDGSDDVVVVPVIYADGGNGRRVFDPDNPLRIERP